MKQITQRIETVHDKLGIMGAPAAFFWLRAILAYTFMEAGLKKIGGNNWFAQMQESFPFPFDVIPAEVSWFLAGWTEVIAGALLLLGLATRYAAFSLIILTAVATAAVHWPDSYSGLAELWQGFVISNDGDGNFRLPLILFLMLMPLLFAGAGRLSVDALIHQRRQPDAGSIEGRAAFVNELMMVVGMVLIAFGLVVTVAWGWLTVWHWPLVSVAGFILFAAGVWRSGAGTTFSTGLTLILTGIPLTFLFPFVGPLLTAIGVVASVLACSSLQRGHC